MKKFLLTTLKIPIFFIGWAVISGIVDIPDSDPIVWRFFAELIPLAVMLLFTAVFLWLDKKTAKIPIRSNWRKGTFIGAAIGAVWIGIAAAILIFSEQLTVAGKNDVPFLWLWIVSAFVNVIMQELLVRGYLYQLLKTSCNLPVAVIITTALFTFMHGGAFEAGVVPVVNVVTMCLFTTALYESEGTLLAPIMAHAVWNIVGALFLGGVRLAEDYPHIFTLSASANTLLSGGDCMIEGSIVVMILNVALTALFYVRYQSRKNRIQ